MLFLSAFLSYCSIMTLCRRSSNVDFFFLYLGDGECLEFIWMNILGVCATAHPKEMSWNRKKNVIACFVIFGASFFILFYYHFAEKLPEFIPEHVAIHASDKEYWINLFFCAVCIFFIYVSSSLNFDVGRQSKNSNYIRSRDRYLSPVKASKDVIAALMILFMHLFKSNDK